MHGHRPNSHDRSRSLSWQSLVAQSSTFASRSTTSTLGFRDPLSRFDRYARSILARLATASCESPSLSRTARPASFPIRVDMWPNSTTCWGNGYARSSFATILGWTPVSTSEHDSACPPIRAGPWSRRASLPCGRAHVPDRFSHSGGSSYDPVEVRTLSPDGGGACGGCKLAPGRSGCCADGYHHGLRIECGDRRAARCGVGQPRWLRPPGPSLRSTEDSSSSTCLRASTRCR